MIQLFAYDGGERYELDLYAEDPIKINISAEDIIDIPRIDSAFSRQFRIPATSNNNRFFKWWYTAGALDFDITKRVQAEIHVDGLLYRKGQIRLQMVYHNEQQDRLEFEIAFLGETREFGTQVGDGFMNALNVSEIDHALDHTVMHASQLPFGDPGLFLNGWIRYGIGIRGYTYDADGNILEHGQLTVDNTKQKSFRAQNSYMSYDQYVPFIQIKYLIDKIFAQTDFTYSANSVFNDDWFKYLYIDGIGDVQTVTPTNNSDGLAYSGSPQYFSTGGDEDVILFDTIFPVDNSNYNKNTGEYTITGVQGTTTLIADIVIADQASYDGGNTATYGISLYRRRGGVVTLIDSDSAAPAGSYSPGQQYTIPLQVFVDQGVFPMQDGDVYWVTAYYISGFSENPVVGIGSQLEVANTDTVVLGRTLLRDDVKTIEFFKSILTKFRLVMVPSKEIENEFNIRPWNEYIGTGEIFDWTDKLDVSKDRVLKPVFFEQSATIFYEDQVGSDVKNIDHQDQYDAVYGRRIYDSQNELLKDTRNVTTVFSPTPVDQIPGFDPLDNQLEHTATFIVPYFCKESEETDKDGEPKLLPIKTRPRLLFWNGMRPTSDNDTIGFYDQHIGAGVQHFTYSAFSYLSEVPSTVDTLDLNWQKDVQYFEGYTYSPSGSLGQDVFERYWASYIASLYSSEARLLTAYFVLDNEDMRNLTFDDIIFIQDSWWRLHKIVDAPLGNLSSVKVELIKLIDYVLPEAGGDEIEPGDYTGDLPYDPSGDTTWGGGFGGWGGTPVNEYYSLQNCENPEELYIGSYPGIITVGSAVKISGSANIDKCFEVQAQLVGSFPAVPILQVFPNCTECLGS